MRKKNIKILITNIVSLNTGDAAILQGMINILKEKYGTNTDIVVYDKEAQLAQKYYVWEKFRESFFGNSSTSQLQKLFDSKGYLHIYDKIKYFRLKVSLLSARKGFNFLAKILTSTRELEIIEDYIQADLIVSTGGTYLIENYSLQRNIYDYILSLETGNSLGFFTQTLGPFKTQKYIVDFRCIFNRAAFIFLRDEKSMKHLHQIGVTNPKIKIAPDIVFSLCNQDLFGRPGGKCNSAAISVRELKYFDEEMAEHFYSSVAALTCRLIELQYQITFISTCQGIPEYWTDDSKTAQQIFDRLPDGAQKFVTIDTNFRQPDEIVQTYSEFDFVVATRMHAAILSICAGTPVFGIAYEFKIDELFASLGLSELSVNIRDIAPNKLCEGVEKLVEHYDDYLSKFHEISLRKKAESNNVMDFLPDLG